RVNHRTLLRLPDALEAAAVRAQLAGVISDPSVRVSAFDEGRPGWRRFYSQLTSYLGLVGMASLLVGGVGVAAAVRAFVARKRDTIAILKCLGATSRLLLAGYLVQAAGLGLVGSLAGALLGVALAPLVGSLLSGLVPLALETRLEAWGLLRGVAIGTGLTMLIALWPLGEVRAASPSLLFRRDVEGNAPWPTRRWLAALPLGIGVMLLVAVGRPGASLGQQLDLERRREAPSFFFVDIQPGQRERFESIVRDVSGVTPAVTPVVRARLAALDGHAITRALVEQRRGRGDDGIGYFTRDYVLTAASALPAGNVVTVGHWWSDGATAAHEASVEEAAARHLGLAVGSSIAFDVQGVRLEARVTSLRQVDW